MPESIAAKAALIADKFRERFGERGAALVLALAMEVLLVLALLTLGQQVMPGTPEGDTLTSVNISAPTPTPDDEDDADTANESEAETPEPTPQPQDRPDPQPQPQPEPAIEPEPDPVEPTPPPPIPVKKTAPPRKIQARIRNDASAPAAPAPTGQQADSQRVAGSGPNGEALYAASWYREPTDGELAGYLSTATGPGWGLIMCRTAANWRVEDCRPIDEWPEGSNINRAILAAAWQFKVRPPRVGGKSMVGEWVRIRIDYGINRR